MLIPWRDRPFVRWAKENGFPYYYTEEYGLPHRCLKLHLGVLTAYIYDGKLVRVQVQSEGNLIDQMMYEFSQLFAQCARHDAYLEQALCYIGQQQGEKG